MNEYELVRSRVGPDAAGFFNPDIYDVCEFLGMSKYEVLKASIEPDVMQRLDLRSFKGLCSFLGTRNVQVIEMTFMSGMPGCSVRGADDGVMVYVNENLDDDEKIIFALHEFIEGHLDRSRYLFTLDYRDIVFGWSYKQRRRRAIWESDDDSDDDYDDDTRLGKVFNYWFSLSKYLSHEEVTWRLCSEMIEDAGPGDDRKEKLGMIVERDLDRVYQLKEVLDRCWVQMFLMFEYRRWRLWPIEPKIALRLYQELVILECRKSR